MATDFLTQNEIGNIQVVVNLSDLREFGEKLIRETLEIKPETTESYLTMDETAAIFGVDRSTLWRWNKAEYLTPIRVGGKPKYRKSDIDRILEGGRK
ncbi:helix-turn-helix domain-containing protein [Massilibacteroides sp.]|uniref:helix-turn-helix domain-containing protein n=1 Tax=Massilibacteroides sp. TaxID=2034766 RepID=UPI0026207343|nr:helix-turn-helix domain-containing protein [Massilibacteroides sp.]MDD2495570.1 helix-turn-helix domain-containing protein [Tissierellia bacterium]MDD4515722.1 helix-turn-helix domain-containing protein [Massilibacteroides sp.]